MRPTKQHLEALRRTWVTDDDEYESSITKLAAELFAEIDALNATNDSLSTDLVNREAVLGLLKEAREADRTALIRQVQIAQKERNALRADVKRLCAEILEDDQLQEQSYARETKLRERISTLYEAIEHGDEKHQHWLKNAIYRHFNPEYEKVIAITDGPIIPENITIDARYHFEKRIKALRQELATCRDHIMEHHHKAKCPQCKLHIGYADEAIAQDDKAAE